MSELKAERTENMGLARKVALIPAKDLKGLFETIHNYIYANEGLTEQRISREILKLLFMKTADELSANSKLDFCIAATEASEVRRGNMVGFAARMDSLFASVKKRYPGIFEDNEKLILHPPTLAYVVGKLSPFTFERTPADVKGMAFQTFVYAHFRGARGEFFTPYPIARLCVGMLNPSASDLIIDPACGFGGFLVEAIRNVRSRNDPSAHHDGLRGIEVVLEVASVAKMQLILYGHDDADIIAASSLNSFEEINEEARSAGNREIRPSSFDLVLTNPPFGSRGRVAEPSVLGQYQLARRWKRTSDGTWIPTGSMLSGQSPDILFIERCLQLLKENGRMAIVLPEGILSNQSLGYVRQFVRSKTRILGVVSLPADTFLPYGSGSKTCVLLLQRKDLPPRDYRIFLATCERVGYDSRGKTLVRGEAKRKQAKYPLDLEPGPSSQVDALDTDIPDIINAYRKFERRELQ